MNTVLHSLVIFVLLWVVVRVAGKRQLSQLSAFDMVMLVVLGDLVADAVLAEDTSLTNSVIAVSTFGLLTVVLSWVSWKVPGSRPVFEGVPTLMIHQGEVLEASLKLERITMEDLREAARKEGHRTLDDIDMAVLENDGTFSFFTRDGDSDAD